MKTVEKILNSDLPLARKVSKLEILALKAFASSPIQKAIRATIEALKKGT